MKPSITLFADFNNADTLGRIRLNTRGTINDLQLNNITLTEGLKVLLDDKDELKAIGIIEFSGLENIWVAKVDWDDLENISSK
jgi:hypothetical protein